MTAATYRDTHRCGEATQPNWNMVQLHGRMIGKEHPAWIAQNQPKEFRELERTEVAERALTCCRGEKFRCVDLEGKGPFKCGYYGDRLFNRHGNIHRCSECRTTGGL